MPLGVAVDAVANAFCKLHSAPNILVTVILTGAPFWTGPDALEGPHT